MSVRIWSLVMCIKALQAKIQVAPCPLRVAARIIHLTAFWMIFEIDVSAALTCCLSSSEVIPWPRSQWSFLTSLELVQVPIGAPQLLAVSDSDILVAAVDEYFPSTCKRDLHLGLCWHFAMSWHHLSCCWSQDACQVRKQALEWPVPALQSVDIVQRQRGWAKVKGN